MSQTAANMKCINAPILLLLGLTAQLAYGQKTKKNPAQAPAETTVGRILGDPSVFNNRIVNLRGYVAASSESSLLVDEHCDTSLLWLASADGSAPPQLAAIVNGNVRSGGDVPPPSLWLLGMNRLRAGVGALQK